jgi:hypothetical protein
MESFESANGAGVSPKPLKTQFKRAYRRDSAADSKHMASPPRMHQGVPSISAIQQSPPVRRAQKQLCVSPSRAFGGSFRVAVAAAENPDRVSVRGTRITVGMTSRETLHAAAPKVRSVLEYRF